MDIGYGSCSCSWKNHSYYWVWCLMENGEMDELNGGMEWMDEWNGGMNEWRNG